MIIQMRGKQANEWGWGWGSVTDWKVDPVVESLASAGYITSTWMDFPRFPQPVTPLWDSMLRSHLLC